MTWSDPAAGQTLTGAKLVELATYGVAISAYKSANTARNTTIVSAADPELAIVLPANRTYDVQMVLHASTAANAAGDFRLALVWTNTASVLLGGHGLSITLASGSSADMEGLGFTTDTTSGTGDIGYGLSTTRSVIAAWATVTTGGSNVTLSVAWAQQNSNANDTTLHAGSKIVARRANV